MPRVLIVDDDPTTVKLLQTLLELDGFDVSIAARGQIAIDSLDTVHPDAFLIDYHLQDMEGTELVVKLRANPKFAKAPIIMASGLDKSDEAMDAGANEFLVKPFEPNDLAEIFYDLLG